MMANNIKKLFASYRQQAPIALTIMPRLLLKRVIQSAPPYHKTIQLTISGSWRNLAKSPMEIPSRYHR